MKPVIFMTIVGILDALHCDKEFTYYDNYGHGFDITCEGITREHLYLLENITINNEMSLKIENSTLRNASPKIFHNVQNIRYLTMENSTITFPKVVSIFKILGKLQFLSIINTEFHVNNYTFSGLNRLNELVLTNNSLESFEKDSFSNLTDLKVLHVTENQIKDIENIPLCELTNLRILNLSRNDIYNLKAQIFHCKNFYRLTDLVLNNKNYAVQMNSEKVSNFTYFSSELAVLDLSYNHIDKLNGSLANLKFLKVLHLEGNRISIIKKSDLNLIHDLEEIYLNDNVLDTVEKSALDNSENLELIDLSNNKLKFFSLSYSPILTSLNMANNEVDINTVNSINGTVSLETLILRNNKFRNIEPYSFQKFSTLKELDLSGNLVKLYNNSFSGLAELKSLSLSNNNIDNLPDDIFCDLKSLQNLDLSRNRMKSIAYNDTFASLTNLEILNISHNLLEDLNYVLLQPLVNLHILDIADNKLHAIQYDFIISKLPLLSVLNIKSNLLSCEFLLKIIEYLKQKDVSYTIFEKLDVEKENVAGIYCKSENDIVPSTFKSESNSSSNALFDFSLLLAIILAMIILGVAVFKIYVFLKRRKYRADEFELIVE